MQRVTHRTCWMALAAGLLVVSPQAIAQSAPAPQTQTPDAKTANTVPQDARELAAEKQTSKQLDAAGQPAQQRTQRIVVSIPDRKLALIEDGEIVRIYRVAVGAKESPSPIGTYTIVHRIAQPTYYAPGVVIPPGNENPLGPRWIGLSAKGFGIHGTNQPRSIGHKASHGCIRLRNTDVEDLFDRVRVGSTVELVGERTEEIAEIFGGAPAAVRQAVATTEKTEAGEASEDSGQS